MRERIAIIEGARTPFCKANGLFRDYQADDLAAYAVREAVACSEIDPKQIDEFIFGNVMTPIDQANIARIIAMKASLPEQLPAFTVNRNCASGMEAIVSGANRILAGNAQIVVVGGTESMTHFPITFPENMRHFLIKLSKTKTLSQKLKMLLHLRPSMFKPHVPTIGDPLCGLSMGQTAEVLAREFGISRSEQDKYALESQNRAQNALKSGFFDNEIYPIPLPPKYNKVVQHDDGIRIDQTIEALQKLRPCFEKVHGSVTAGTSSQLTDGAVALLLTSQSRAHELGLNPIGYLTRYGSAGLQPNRMGLGPVFAIAKLLQDQAMQLNHFDLIEINEAFAVQVLAVIKAAASKEFAEKELGLSSPLGEISLDKLNIHGGAIALGHPLGASGARLVLTLLKSLKAKGLQNGLATLCVGGGQGEAVMLEVN